MTAPNPLAPRVSVLAKHRHLLLAFAAAVVVTSTLQMWIGMPQVYVPHAEKAALIHTAILEQHPPAGKTWTDLGANGLAQRMPVVLLAEALRQVSGLGLPRVYLIQDSVFLLLELLLLMAWLRRFLPPSWVAVGWLWFVAIAPTTYLFYYFHPWDRPSQCLWLVALIGLQDRRHWQFFAALAAGMIIKMDMLFLPFIYAAVTFGEGERKRWVLRVLGAFAIAGGVFIGLQAGFPREPNAAEQGRALAQLAEAVADFKKLGFTYPPILMFGLPLALIAAGWKRLERYHRVAFLYTLPVLSLYAATSEFRESRTHAPMFLLLLPGAVVVARRWLENANSSATTGPSSET